MAKTKALSETLVKAVQKARKEAIAQLTLLYKKVDKAQDLDGEGVEIEDGPVVPGFGDDQVAACVARVFVGQVEIDDASSSSTFLKYGEMDTDTLMDVLAAMEDVVSDL